MSRETQELFRPADRVIAVGGVEGGLFFGPPPLLHFGLGLEVEGDGGHGVNAGPIRTVVRGKDCGEPETHLSADKTAPFFTLWTYPMTNLFMLTVVLLSLWF
jgi:hypothetical protein